LPGVEVDVAGKITINGKAVDKILVNGKPFFGNDPTIATRNLAKDMIVKVQVTDIKTKAEAFAGDEGNKDKKTINHVINEENAFPCNSLSSKSNNCFIRELYVIMVSFLSNRKNICTRYL
jgi:hypothetical protein